MGYYQRKLQIQLLKLQQRKNSDILQSKYKGKTVMICSLRS